ncbi:MAG: DNA methylase N-4, partial [Lentisphaeria bacterium]|nr:DNA methylase N-4 [Lentisphaeria bacterium]
MTYEEFLHTKIIAAPESGFAVDPDQINPVLKPHQRDAVRWGLKMGRCAFFESFGLGKTVQELEFCRLAAEHEDGRALLVLPLGVRQEFARDAAELLHIDPPV